eukprot:Seg1260.5 transcript_id=Seg1260.5/GoldUCD/mRNA.D3Y31 product="Bone morphogenetic protein 1" protein_id=Seg1260.5/GoldUCD/D3Y31
MVSFMHQRSRNAQVNYFTLFDKSTSQGIAKIIFVLIDPRGDLFTLPHNYVDSARKKLRGPLTRETILHGNSTYHVAPWESRVIPFEFDPNLDTDLAAYFVRAMYHIERYTCVQFRRKMPDENMASGYIHMQKSPKLCDALPGRKAFERTEINITTTCPRGTAVHLMMHSLGFQHTQQREDRDEYINIKFDNIKKQWQTIFNFQKGKNAFGGSYKGTTFGVPYDFNSIMHSRLWIGKDNAIDPSKPGMEIKKKWKKICAKNKFGCIIEQSRGLSKSDTIQVNKLFKCKIKPQTSWECPIYTKLKDFKTKYFQEFRKDLCLRLNLKQ